MDPQQRILLETVVEAMESNGYLRRHRRESGDPVGYLLGRDSLSIRKTLP